MFCTYLRIFIVELHLVHALIYKSVLYFIDSASNVDLLLCKVCMDRERGVVFQPCGHFVTCWNCASLIADCPVCRRPITHKIRTYIS